MPSKARAKRQASIPTTMVSRKLTKAPAKSRSGTPKDRAKTGAKSVKKKLAKDKIKRISWLRTTESIAPSMLWSTSPQPPLEASWREWLDADNRFVDADWAATAISYAEIAAASLAGEGGHLERLAELKSIAIEAEAIAIESAPLVHLLLRGELRLKIGIATGDPALCAAALMSLIDGLECLLDGEGTPHKKYLADFPKLVGCWLRSISLAKRKGIETPNLSESQNEALAQCHWLPIRLAQLSRADGSAIFFPESEVKVEADLIREALKLWGDKDDRRNAACLRTDIIKPLPKPAVEKMARAVCGDWSGIGVFRSDARPDAAHVGVALEDGDFQLEFGVKGSPLVCGAAKLTLTRDGHSLAPTGPWEEVCRHQEPEVEYWELERTHERGVWIQRQIVLACKDRFAYISDNIVADGPGDLTYRLETPLATQVSASPSPETREITLHLGKLQAAVLPLAAEEWQTTPSYFEFRAENGNLRFDGRTRQSRMSIPWVVDLRANRKVEEVTWRQLRVAEDLQNLPRDIAVAFRWQIGTQQWMAYRSLAAPSNRTVLGQNLVGDFLLARVSADGKTKTIVEIE